MDLVYSPDRAEELRANIQSVQADIDQAVQASSSKKVSIERWFRVKAGSLIPGTHGSLEGADPVRPDSWPSRNANQHRTFKHCMMPDIDISEKTTSRRW